MKTDTGQAYSYIQDILSNTVRYNDDKFSEFGKIGISAYFHAGSELVEKDADLSLIRWFAHLVDESTIARFERNEAIIGLLEACASRTPSMARFIELHPQAAIFSPTRLLLDGWDGLTPEQQSTALWIISNDIITTQRDDLGSRTADLLCSLLTDTDGSNNKDAFDCAISLSLPEFIPRLTKTIRILVDNGSWRDTSAQPLLTILIHAIWWPGPSSQSSYAKVNRCIHGVAEELQAIPVTCSSAKVLCSYLESLGNKEGGTPLKICKDWSLNYGGLPTLRNIAWDSECESMLDDALAGDYINMRHWIDNNLRDSIINSSLINYLGVAIHAAESIPVHRKAISIMLAEMECYIYTATGHTNMGIETGMSLTQLHHRLLSYLMIQDVGDINVKDLIAEFPEIISQSGLHIIGKLLSTFPQEHAHRTLLEQTRKEVLLRLNRRSPSENGSQPAENSDSVASPNSASHSLSNRCMFRRIVEWFSSRVK